MAWAGARPQYAKLALARLAEVVGRLKPNGRVVRRSPLSPVVELEALATGIHGKLLLWELLGATFGGDGPPVALDELEARAQRQHAAVQRHRLDAGRTALRS